ncbi:helix-turn-helix domain-containing protein [Afifella sp. IM 167]|uniref:AraC family transcriptional regulator n=1 Tax=Afifella sp. IM 167 TaxID=2033586 RepID=UPI001CCACE5B|nr:helix-turn-helix transcriptional regulator [Afifella sp. IM 167]MBZ8134711.1 AraC family transcriptional regulator [Afifella sp. IM 167]
MAAKHPPLLAFQDDVPRPVVARGRAYPDGWVVAAHNHRRGQLLCGSNGVVQLVTADGTWMMPPERGMWIPPGIVHEVTMLGPVKMQSLYFAPDALAGMPAHIHVVAISPLMRVLLEEAIALPHEYELEGRDGALMRLLEHEVQRLPPLPLSLPFPAHAALARLCRAFALSPTPHSSIDDWSGVLNLSRRTFTRLFRRETGLTFVAWRQQACLMAALPRLAAGETVTSVAIDLGYDNPAAFSTMFRKALGVSPRDYLERDT